MIEETRYRCEICCKVHLNEDDCTKCESSHLKDPKVVGLDYRRGAIYPRFITVKFENGKTVQYSNICVLTNEEP